MAPQGIKQIKNKTEMKQIIIIFGLEFERNLFIEHSHH
jgi:hypothetical protein